jgi:2-oxoisovalerate dehydrogenase E1 component
MSGVLTPGSSPDVLPGIVRIEKPEDPRLSPAAAARLLLELEVIRRAEEWLLEHEELVHGPVHSSIGQEAVAVGTTAALEERDMITSTHRAHHHVLSKTIGHYAGPAYDPLVDPLPDAVVDCVTRTVAEILGLANGWAGGRGGSMHLIDRQSGVACTTAIVGGGVPIAAGLAYAGRLSEPPWVAVAFLGDGAASIGSFHEGVSMARVWNLPAIFVVENNLYSVATTVEETVGFSDIVLRAAGQDMLGILVDGMDVLAVREAVRRARAHVSARIGPVLIEAKTYRYRHQNGKLPGSAYRYRTKDEEAEWSARDPLDALARDAIELGLLSAEQVEHVRAQAALLVAAAADACTAEVDGKLAVRPERWPRPGDAETGVRGDLSELSGAPGLPEVAGETEPVRFSAAISRTVARALEREPRAFVLGEEVSHLGGGAYGSTKDALLVAPDRVLSTPIAENGFCGLALGAAIAGLRPIVEVMFPDFALEAADQLFNHIAKARHVYGGSLPIPIVVRTRTAQGRGFGPQHSADPAALFALFPGWRITAPSTPADYVGLLNAALLCDDPVLVVEHHALWTSVGEVSTDSLDYVLPPGQGRLVREGKDLTVIAWSHPLHRVLPIAEELAGDGVEIEVIDPRWLDRASLDRSLIERSVAKTGALAIVEDAPRSHSIGLHIADELAETLDPHLRLPVVRITGKDVSPPVSRVLEASVLLSDDSIRDGLHRATQLRNRSMRPGRGTPREHT